MRSDSSSPRCARFGPYVADFQTQELRKHGIRLKISGQPMQILEALLAYPGQLVTREALQKQLWPEHIFVDSNHGLNAAVNKLRDALSDSAEEPKYIETLPRRGYRFIGMVEVEVSPPALEEAPGPAVVAAVMAKEPAEEEYKHVHAIAPAALRRGAKPWVVALFAAAGLLVCSFGASLIANNRSEKVKAMRRQLLKHAAEGLATAARDSQATDQLSGTPDDARKKAREAEGSVSPVEAALRFGPRLRTVVARRRRQRSPAIFTRRKAHRVHVEPHRRMANLGQRGGRIESPPGQLHRKCRDSALVAGRAQHRI